MADRGTLRDETVPLIVRRVPESRGELGSSGASTGTVDVLNINSGDESSPDSKDPVAKGVRHYVFKALCDDIIIYMQY